MIAICTQSKSPSTAAPRSCGTSRSPEVAAASLLKGLTTHYLLKSVYPVKHGDAVLVHAGQAASGASLAVRGTLALFGASSGPVPPVDPQRLNSAGSVYLTRRRWFTTPAHATNSLGAQANCLTASDKVLDVRVSGTYPLAEAARAHTDLHSRKTTGAIVLLP